MKKTYISPSQITKFDEELYPDSACRRQWGFNYIDKIRTPSTPKQGFGTDTHWFVERWLKERKLPDESPAGKVAAQGIKPGFLPTPHPALLVEHRVELEVDSTLILRGVADLIDPVTDPSMPTVKDFKTTSDPRWARKPEQVYTDPQPLIYGEWAMRETGKSRFYWEWLYFLASCTRDWPEDGSIRKPKGIVKVPKEGAVVDRDSAEFRQGLMRVEYIAREIQKTRETYERAIDIPANPSACQAYGGCPFIEKCDLTGPEIMVSHLAQFDKREHPKQNPLTIVTQPSNVIPTTPTENPMANLFDELRATLPAPPAATPAPPAATPTPPAATPTPPAAIPAALGLDPAVKKEGETETTHAPAPTSNADRVLEVAGMGIKDLKDLAGEYGLKKSQPKDDLVKAILEHEAGGAPQTPSSPPQVVPETPPQPVPPSPTPEPVVHTPEAPGDDPSKDLIILFDCAFSKRPAGFDGVQSFSAYVEPLARQVAAKYNVDHFGLIDYAKGPPELAAALEQAWQKDKPTGVLLVDSSSQYGRACRDVLIRYAQTAVQAVR